MQPFEFVQPEQVEDVLSAIADSDGFDVMLWGGGTSTVLMMKQGLIAPERLVGLNRLTQFAEIKQRPDGGIELGAGVRIRQLEKSELLRRILPCVAETAAGIGNVRVRNAAMLGGHLVHADPAQDLPPLLLTLDAEIHLASSDGQRTLPINEFFVDTMETAIQPNELLTKVVIPAEAVARRSRYVKFAPRSLDDYATVGVACSVNIDSNGVCTTARVAVGGAGPTAARFPDAEELLVGKELTADVCKAAANIVGEQVEPWDDARGTADYKRAMSRVWVERTLRSLV